MVFYFTLTVVGTQEQKPARLRKDANDSKDQVTHYGETMPKKVYLFVHTNAPRYTNVS